MTESGSEGVLRAAAEAAALAPSVHNTQPWRFEIGQGRIDVFADFERSLDVLDPTRRQLTISCGCAVFNARVALAASGRGASVQRVPNPDDPSLLATILVGDGAPEADIAGYEPVLPERRTNRRAFAHDEVPFELIDALEKAATAEGSTLMPIYREEMRLEIARLSQQADRLQVETPAYQAELRKWITDDVARLDGIPTEAVPHGGQGHDEIPMRHFDPQGKGGLPTETRSSHNQALLLLGTAVDDVASWIRAGEALERIQLEVARRDYAISPLTQIVEVPSTREQLRRELDDRMFPHLLLRVGKAEATPPSRRRHVDEVIVERH